ncbi:cyclic nucleotide-binding domain-containing protein, partial [Actinomadura welshii]
MGEHVLDHGAVLARELAPGLNLRKRLQEGGVSPALVHEGHDAELIVVGSHEPDQMPVGSTALQVPAHAGRPVAVVRDGASRDGQVVVGVDGSPGADAALAFGQRIFNESDPAERFWLVQDGTVAVDLRTPGRGPVVIETFGPGSVLGWSWLFRPYRWRFGGYAGTPVRAIEFDGRLVRTLCAVDPSMGYELTRRIAELVVERLEATQTRLMEL